MPSGMPLFFTRTDKAQQIRLLRRTKESWKITSKFAEYKRAQ